MRKSRIALAVCFASGIVGCGGGNKSGSGSNAVCSLTSDQTEIIVGSEVKFKVKANFAATTVKLNDIEMYDQTSGLDLSTPENISDQHIFEKDFVLNISEEKDIVAAVSSGGPEVYCSTPLKIKEESRTDLANQGEFTSLFDLTSTDVGQGIKQVVYKCTVPNEFEYKDTILRSFSSSSCTVAVPENEITGDQKTLNEIPENYLPNATYGDRTPTLDHFGISKISGDQTDSAFTWHTNLSKIRWAGFTSYNDCHTSKAEMYYRERNNDLKKALLIWDHVQDPLTKQKIPKLRVSPDYPKGINLRGAQAENMTMYFYCYWNHQPKNLLVPSIFREDIKGTFADTNSLKYDVEIVRNGKTLFTHHDINFEEFRKVSKDLTLNKNDTLGAKISIKTKENQILLSNDKSVADNNDNFLEKWANDCSGKITDTIQILNDNASSVDEFPIKTVRLKFKLCDFSNSFETKVKAIETTTIDQVKHQVVVKCPITATLSSQTASFVYSSSGDSRCDYYNPTDDSEAENLIPKSYSNDGPLSEKKPIIKAARLTNNAGVVHISWTDLSTAFFGFMNCHKARYEVQNKRSDVVNTAIISFNRYFDDSNATVGEARTNHKWNLVSGQDLPSPAEIIAVNDKKFSIYFYCDWSPNEKIGEGVSPH